MLNELGLIVAKTEFKFSEGEPGHFEGYGSVYGLLDSHKDVVEKGAFDKSLETHLKSGTMPSMYAEHSAYVEGGDPLPVGVWTKMESDDKGLKVAGKISALDTDHGKRILSLMKDKALTGLSIAFTIPPGGARMGKKAGEPRRTLTEIGLRSLDIVANPSNDAARIEQLKHAFMNHLKVEGDENSELDTNAAADYVAAAILMQDKWMSGDYYNSPKQMAIMMDMLRRAYAALTGDTIPEGLDGWMKNSPFTIGVIRTTLVDELGLSRKKADDLAKNLFDKLPRDEKSTPAPQQEKLKSAMSEMSELAKAV